MTGNSDRLTLEWGEEGELVRRGNWRAAQSRAEHSPTPPSFPPPPLSSAGLQEQEDLSGNCLLPFPFVNPGEDTLEAQREVWAPTGSPGPQNMALLRLC